MSKPRLATSKLPPGTANAAFSPSVEFFGLLAQNFLDYSPTDMEKGKDICRCLQVADLWRSPCKCVRAKVHTMLSTSEFVVVVWGSVLFFFTDWEMRFLSLFYWILYLDLIEWQQHCQSVWQRYSLFIHEALCCIVGSHFMPYACFRLNFQHLFFKVVFLFSCFCIHIFVCFVKCVFLYSFKVSVCSSDHFHVLSFSKKKSAANWLLCQPKVAS